MDTIQKLCEPQFLGETYGRIFISDDPFGWPFAERIKSGMLFYPTAGYHLSKSQYNAVVAAAKANGDEGFIVSVVEGEGEIIGRGESWWCKYPNYEDYLGLPLVLENAIYSKRGSWGIMISHEDHAIIGGSAGFVEMLRAGYPEWREDVQKLTEVWKDNPCGAWTATVASMCEVP